LTSRKATLGGESVRPQRSLKGFAPAPKCSIQGSRRAARQTKLNASILTLLNGAVDRDRHDPFEGHVTGVAMT
jgi:hypothetical protein